VGNPAVKDAKVTAEIINPSVQQQKVTSIRYKAKKRVHKIRGHRQKLAKIKIKSIKP
jgi:ribosomal protein L21